MRVVFDTNVLVAAFLTEGVCAKLLMRARRREYTLILSREILDELQRVLREKFSVSQREFGEVRALVAEAAAEIVNHVAPIRPLCRDPDDDTILACARSVEADYVVMGDKDPLAVGRYGMTVIVTPRDFEVIFQD